MIDLRLEDSAYSPVKPYSLTVSNNFQPFDRPHYYESRIEYSPVEPYYTHRAQHANTAKVLNFEPHIKEEPEYMLASSIQSNFSLSDRTRYFQKESFTPRAAKIFTGYQEYTLKPRVQKDDVETYIKRLNIQKLQINLKVQNGRAHTRIQWEREIEREKLLLE